MRKLRVQIAGLLAVVLMAGGFAMAGAQTAPAAETDRWIHVRVEETNAQGEKTESVRVNLPLSVAEKVLPAIKVNKLEHGKLKMSEIKIENVDVRAILEAVKDAKDGEFVRVESKKEDVRVAKQGGYLIVQVRDAENEKVDVKLPMSVVQALLSSGKDELDLVAGIRALMRHGDTELVTVHDKNTRVRVWVDGKNSSE